LAVVTDNIILPNHENWVEPTQVIQVYVKTPGKHAFLGLKGPVFREK